MEQPAVSERVAKGLQEQSPLWQHWAATTAPRLSPFRHSREEVLKILVARSHSCQRKSFQRERE